MIFRYLLFAVLATGVPLSAVSVPEGAWDPVGGSYYELSTRYSVRNYRPLNGTGNAVFTGILLHENNGIIGTYLLTLAADRETEEVWLNDRMAPRGESDLRFYFSSMGGNAGGFDWSFYLGAFVLPGHTVLKLGLGMGMVHGTYRTTDGIEGKWSSFKLGIPVRLVWCPWPRYLRFAADIDMNFISMFSRDRAASVRDGDEILFAPTPVSIEATFSPLERMLLSAGIMLPGGDEGFSLGFAGGVGVRF